MEQMLEGTNGLQDHQDGAMAVWRIRQAVDRYLIERGVGHYCKVTVRQRDNVFELEGSVDSQWTRAVLFSMVPFNGGKKHIIDRIHIVDEPLKGIPLP